MIRRAWLVVLTVACSDPATPAPAAPPVPGPLGEPIRLARGARTVEVSCQAACGPLRSELERLSDGCRRDPLSTPHAVSSDLTVIGLGCCEEAASIYRDACGDETLSPCLSEWRALCQHAFTVPASAISGEGGS